MKRRTFVLAVAASLVPLSCIACPPPKYKVGQLVELSNGVRLYIVKHRVKNDKNRYDLSLLKNGKTIVETDEAGLKLVK